MDRRVLTVLTVAALAASSTGCLDWGSLYAEPVGDDIDAGDIDDTPDAFEQPGDAGCSDGVIEMAAFDDPEGGAFDIVACGGAWTVPGVVGSDETTCGGQAGDDGDNLSGEGCSVADLCAPGWHVCLGASDVSAHRGESLCEQLSSVDSATYITRQSGRADAEACAENGGEGDTADDVYGCGTLGLEAINCPPLGRRLAIIEEQPDESGCPPPFHCGEDSLNEGASLTKSEPSGGGVLCCRD